MKNFVQKTGLLFVLIFMVVVGLTTPISVYACNTTPTPTPIPSPTLTPTPIPSPTLTPTPIPSPTLTPTPTDVPSPTPTLTPTPEPSVTPTVTPTLTVTPTPIPEGVTKVSITKSNNKSGGAGANDNVIYTLTVKNDGDTNLTDLRVIDVLPGGFLFVYGSTKVNGTGYGDPSNNSGRLTWNLSPLGAKETVTIEYVAKISDDIDAAVYTNIATCVAKVVNTGSEADCNIVKSNVPVDSSLSFSASVGTTTTQVLGTSTAVLPATGDNPYYLFTSFTMLSTGVLVKLMALVFKKEEEYEFA